MTPRGHLLARVTPGSLREWTLWHGSSWSLATWEHFDRAVTTGQSAFEHAFDVPLFDVLRREPELASTFGAAMTSIGRQINAAGLDIFDFSDTGGRGRGGGAGDLLTAILGRHPQFRGTLLDLPDVVTAARQRLASGDFGDRIELAGDDFFTDPTPGGADAYLLKAILHDWDDDRSLRSSEIVVPQWSPDSIFLSVSMVVPGPGVKPDVKENDLQMLTMQTGRERTGSELAGLFELSGLELRETRETPSPMSILIAGPS